MTEQSEQVKQEEAPRSDEDPGSEGETSTAQAEEPTTERQGDSGGGDDRAPLFPSEEADRFRRRWESLQASFVDQPQEAVAQADDLVGDLMQQLTSSFGDKRSELEAQWEQGDEVSTEELRVALMRYRSFFNRLLSA
jgi:hypothetical protein